jgi:voltage-gated potassium channel
MPRHITEKDNFAYLTVALILVLSVSALVDDVNIALGGHLIEATIALALIIGIWSIRAEKRWFRTSFGLITAMIAIFLAGLLLDLKGLTSRT